MRVLGCRVSSRRADAKRLRVRAAATSWPVWPRTSASSAAWPTWPDPDWRFLPIPLHDGQQVQQLRLFLRRRQKRQDGGDGDRGEATRFIVEVKLSRVGDLQLDGLVREKRFDLMLRTRKALPPAMRHRIIEIFETAKGAAGYLGNVGFQASDDWTPMPLADGATGPQSLVI